MNRRRLSTLFAVLLIAVFASVGVLAIRLRQVSGLEAIARCAHPLEIVADDGALLPAVLYRCDAPPGRHAGVVVWPREPGAAGGWAGGLGAWAREGRALLAVTAPRRPGLEPTDLAAAVEALADEPGVDAGRIGVVVEGRLAAAVAGNDAPRDGLPGGAAAVVVADPPAELAAALAERAGARVAVLAADDADAPEGAVVLDRRWFAFGRATLDGAERAAAEFLRRALDVAPQTAREPVP